MAVMRVEDVGKNLELARKAAEQGPVVITEAGQPSMVLMNFEAFGSKRVDVGNLFERLHVEGAEDLDFEVAPRTAGTGRGTTQD